MDSTREWLFITSNITVIIVGIKVVFTLGKIQNQVETMWNYFSKHLILK